MNTDITEEQIKEVLQRLRAYSYYFYYGDDARYFLSRHILEHAGLRFSISVKEDGVFELTRTDGLKILYAVKCVTAPPSSSVSIDNLVYSSDILNKNDLSYEEAVWAEEVRVFVLSAFQRTNAFVFFARSQDVSIERIAKELSMMSRPSNDKTSSS